MSRSNFIDITGQQFGLWKALRYLGDNKWECLCTGCGTTHVVIGSLMRRGGTTMCQDCAKQAQKTAGPKVDLEARL